MNQLFLGLTKQVSPPKRGLYIHDDLPDVSGAKVVFDPAKHSFNPLKDMNYKKARALADVLYTISPQGDNTLTVRNGKRALVKMLPNSKRLDKLEPTGHVGDDEALAMVDDLLQSPVLKRVLSNNDFSFNPKKLILARINRAELGDFDALVLGLFLISHFQGQVVVPDFGFYGRDAHVSLIRQERLIAGVNFLSELAPKLRNSVLLIKDKEASGALYDDAVQLAQLTGLHPDHSREDNPYNDFIDRAMGT